MVSGVNPDIKQFVYAEPKTAIVIENPQTVNFLFTFSRKLVKIDKPSPKYIQVVIPNSAFSVINLVKFHCIKNSSHL